MIEFDFYALEIEIQNERQKAAQAALIKRNKLSEIAQRIHSNAINYAVDRNPLTSQSQSGNELVLGRGNVELRIAVLDEDSYSVATANPNPSFNETDGPYVLNKRELMRRIISLINDWN